LQTPPPYWATTVEFEQSFTPPRLDNEQHKLLFDDVQSALVWQYRATSVDEHELGINVLHAAAHATEVAAIPQLGNESGPKVMCPQQSGAEGGQSDVPVQVPSPESSLPAESALPLASVVVPVSDAAAASAPRATFASSALPVSVPASPLPPLELLQLDVAHMPTPRTVQVAKRCTSMIPLSRGFVRVVCLDGAWLHVTPLFITPTDNAPSPPPMGAVEAFEGAHGDGALSRRRNAKARGRGRRAPRREPHL
jgi:hypothetical protein